MSQSNSSLATGRQTYRGDVLPKPGCHAGPWLGQIGKALRKHFALTVGVAAKECAHGERKPKLASDTCCVCASFDGSGYGCETKVVNTADNRTEDELRSPRLPDQPPRLGSGQFPFLLGGKEVLLLSFDLSLTAFPLQAYRCDSSEKIRRTI